MSPHLLPTNDPSKDSRTTVLVTVGILLAAYIVMYPVGILIGF